MTYGQKKRLKKRLLRILTVNIPVILLLWSSCSRYIGP